MTRDPGTPRRPQPRLAVRELARSGEARRLRLASGLTQQVMADVLGIARGSFYRAESGRLQLGEVLAARYARILRVLADHDEVSRELAAGEHLEAG